MEFTLEDLKGPVVTDVLLGELRVVKSEVLVAGYHGSGPEGDLVAGTMRRIIGNTTNTRTVRGPFFSEERYLSRGLEIGKGDIIAVGYRPVSRHILTPQMTNGFGFFFPLVDPEDVNGGFLSRRVGDDKNEILRYSSSFERAVICRG